MPAASLTASEQVVEQNVSGQGKVSAVLNNVPSLPVDALPPPTDAELKTLTPGGLVFYIRWNTDTPVEMELTVHAGPKNAGEFIFPVLGLDRSPAGGQILFSNPGTATGGYEVITYPATFPIGAYTINAINVGTIATTVTFNAFTSKNGAPGVPDPFFTNLNNLLNGTKVQPTALLLPGVSNNVSETTQIPPLPNLSGFGGASLGNLTPTAAAAIAPTARAVARPTRSAQISNPVTLTIHRPM